MFSSKPWDSETKATASSAQDLHLPPILQTSDKIWRTEAELLGWLLPSKDLLFGPSPCLVLLVSAPGAGKTHHMSALRGRLEASNEASLMVS